MRFDDVRGLTSLPIGRLRERFRYEEVSTVLPVRRQGSPRETLLVATPARLALVTAVPWPQSHWMTRWAPWDAVRVADEPDPIDETDDVYRLVIHVGGLAFHARLTGDAGRRALRDFVVTLQDRQEAIGRRP